MTLSINEILNLNSIDLHAFEIRGAKSGVNNARTTGPVYVDGTYVPSIDTVYGTGVLTHDSSIVTGFSFNPPYASMMDAFNLKLNDLLVANSSSYIVKAIDSSSSFHIDQTSSVDVTAGMTFTFGQREYVIEPDVIINTTHNGTASFTNNSNAVTGSGTTWMTDLTSGDFIQHNHYQTFYKIDSVTSNSTLSLTVPYTGDTTTGPYTAKRWTIGRTKIEYAKDDGIAYDNKSAMWTFDTTKASDRSTETYFSSLEYPDSLGRGTDSSGVLLKFTHSIKDTAPDIMDVAVVDASTTFAQQTQYDTFQFSLPKVPDPEDTMELSINGIKKDMYPIGNQDYILNYSQNPIYTPPPSPDKRKVCNVMFLNGISNMTLPIAATETGQFQFIDSVDKSISEILAGSEKIKTDGIDQTRYQDYMIDQYSGLVNATDSTIHEPIVKYVGVNYASSIDYGFAVYLDGKKLKWSDPGQTDDDILFQTASGRLKPRDSEHPAPGEIYEVHYMIESTPISGEKVSIVTGQTLIRSNFYPIKQQSLLVFKDGDIIDENVDYIVSYLTGRITFTSPLNANNSILLNYTPLSKQINGLSYENDNWQCTVYDSRLTVRDPATYTFGLLNVRLDPKDITILRMYNETRDKDYNFTGASKDNGVIRLQSDSTNTSIGLASTDIVLIDYKFQNQNGGTTEFYPVRVNYLSVNSDTTNFYVEGPNIAQYMPAGSLVNLGIPDGATQYFFQADGTYDGYGTLITTQTPIPQDIVNPRMFITDASVSFQPVGFIASKAVAGSMTLSFQNTNIRNIFRPNTILRIHGDLYQVSSASYDRPQTTTNIFLNSEILKDYTSASDLSSITYSDCPIYDEGITEILPREEVVTLFDQPAFILNNNNQDIVNVIADTTSLTIDSSTFYYVDHPTLRDMSSAIDSSHIGAVSLTTHVPGWQSNKIKPATLSIYQGSNSVLSASPTLWYMDNTDSTDFSLSATGTVVLNNSLQRYDRYNLDYLGRQFLGDSSVNFSTRYFVNLPAKSKVQASFQYKNLDQFYVQAMGQRDFFETVSIPRLKEEGYQLSGNPGQGGSVSSDTNAGASEGGVVNDIFRKKDAEIESRVFKNIYDFFSDRVQAFGNEILAAEGHRIFNNDGMFTDAQQNAATKVVNRIFPFPDYTNNEPVKINPIAGYFFDNGAIFGYGMTTVSSIGGTYWKGDGTNGQLEPGGFIGRASSGIRYKIQTVVSDTSLILDTPFTESSTSNITDGEQYVGAKAYPIYDDDGNLGAKIVGTRNKHFGLSDGNVFSCNLGSATFNEPPLLPLPPVNILKWLFPLSGWSSDQVCNYLMSNIPGLLATTENVLDPNQPFGYRTGIVLRTIPPYNVLVLGPSSDLAIAKLGFTPGTVSVGNLNPDVFGPEVYYNRQELVYLNSQFPEIQSIINSSYANKLDRTSTANLALANNISSAANQEAILIVSEVEKLGDETTALNVVLQEPSLSSYGSSLTAWGDATEMLQKDYLAFSKDYYLYSSWNGKGQDWKWSLDFTDTNQGILGRDSTTGIAVDTTVGPGITPIDGQNTFILQVPPDNDRRFLKATVDGTSFQPVLKFQDNDQTVSGIWTGWLPNSPINSWKSIAFNGSIYVVVGSAGAIQTSPDGINWTSQTPPVFNTLNAIIWTGVLFIAVGVTGTIIFSSNGINWTFEPPTIVVDFYDIIWTGSVAIVVGDFQTIITSPTGLAFSWTVRYSGINDPILGVTWNGSDFVAVGTNYSYSSPDSTVWTSYANASLNGLSVTSMGSTFVLVGSGGVERTSLNGSSWGTISTGTINDLNKAIWTGSQLVTVGNSGTILTSPDALNWTDQTSHITQNLTGIIQDGGQFVATGDLGTVLTSPDVSTWTTRAPTKSAYSINNQITFTGDSTTPLFYISMDSPAPAPDYTTTASDIHFDWTETEGAVTRTFSYASYPLLSNLIGAIDAEPGFGIASVSYSTSYDYADLQVSSGPVGSYPGATIFTGPGSPAFGIFFDTTYAVTSTELNLNGDILLFSSYPAIGDLSSAISSFGSYTVLNSFAPEYNYSLLQNSGDVSTIPPGTRLYFSAPIPAFGIQFLTSPGKSTPRYQTTSTDIFLSFIDGTNQILYTVNYSANPTLQNLIDGINTFPEFDASAIYSSAPTYQYDSLLAGLGAISSSSYTPISLSANSPAIEFTDTIPTYISDSTAIAIHLYPGNSNEFLYTSYSTLNNLETAIDNLRGVNITSLFDPGLIYGSLASGSGSLPMVPPGVSIYLNSIPLFSVYFEQNNPQYVTDSTALNLVWEEDTTTVSQSFPYNIYSTIGAIKTAINNTIGFDATGNPVYDSTASRAFKLTTVSIPVGGDATVYPGLRPCTAYYQTISDQQLNDRSNFDSNRIVDLTARDIFLDSTRLPTVKNSLMTEGLLMTDDGQPGDLYNWANNRFNRRQGCQARLNQIDQQIVSSQSALNVNKAFF
jgi:hypothetical protein